MPGGSCEQCLAIILAIIDSFSCLEPLNIRSFFLHIPPFHSLMKNTNSFSEKAGEKKKIVVCGAGIVGITTAYFLARSGHSVVCLDQAKQPATVASWKNGAFLDPALYVSF